MDAEVAARGRGQQAAQRVERAGAYGALPRVGVVAGPGRVRLAEVRFGDVHEPGIGLEGVVERLAVAAPVGQVADLGGGEVLPAAAGAFGVGDVAGGLLQVGHQPPALEHLGEQVGDAFAGDVRAAELGYRVVSVLAEHAVVERGGATAGLVGVLGARGRRQVRVELVQVQPA